MRCSLYGPGPYFLIFDFTIQIAQFQTFRGCLSFFNCIFPHYIMWNYCFVFFILCETDSFSASRYRFRGNQNGRSICRVRFRQHCGIFGLQSDTCNVYSALNWLLEEKQLLIYTSGFIRTVVQWNNLPCIYNKGTIS